MTYLGAQEIGEIKAGLIIKMTEEGKEKKLEKAEEGKKGVEYLFRKKPWSSIIALVGYPLPGLR